MHLVRSGTHFYLGTGWVPVARELTLEPGEQVSTVKRASSYSAPLRRFMCIMTVKAWSKGSAWSSRPTPALYDEDVPRSLPRTGRYDSGGVWLQAMGEHSRWMEMLV